MQSIVSDISRTPISTNRKRLSDELFVSLLILIEMDAGAVRHFIELEIDMANSHNVPHRLTIGDRLTDYARETLVGISVQAAQTVVGPSGTWALSSMESSLVGRP